MLITERATEAYYFSGVYVQLKRNVTFTVVFPSRIQYAETNVRLFDG